MKRLKKKKTENWIRSKDLSKIESD